MSGKKKRNISLVRTRVYCFSSIIFVLIILSATLWSYFMRVIAVKSINDVGEFYLQEISERNVYSITSEIERRRILLDCAVDTLDKAYPENEGSILGYISVAQRISNLTVLAFTDSDGFIYTEEGIFSGSSELSFLSENIDSFRIYTSLDEEYRNLVVIAVPCSIRTRNGKEIVSCFSGFLVEDIVSEEVLGGANNYSFFEIYERDGTPVLETDENPLNGENLFDYYSHAAKFYEDNKLQAIMDDWKQGNDGYAVYENNKLGITYMYYIPVPGTDWIVLTLMRKSSLNTIIEDNSSKMTRYSAMMILFVVVAMIGIVIMISIILRIENRSRLQSLIERNANKAKTRFLFNMSHDIRTPMNAIIGYAELAKKNVKNRKLTVDYLRKIKLSSDVLMSLINNVLEIARIESGNETLNEKPCCIRDFSNTLSSIIEPMFKAKKIKFERSLNVQHEYIICDSMKVREILLNILSNACKYTNEGGTVSSTTTEVSSEKEGYTIIRTVIQDNGIGMSEDFIPHIFEEFSRERTSTYSRVAGTGLGMQIVKKYLDFMGGNIDIESKVGKGTKITVSIPYKYCEEKDIPVETGSIESVDIEAFVNKRVLLAEDNDLNAEIAVAVLNGYGFVVDRVVDGEACVRKLNESEDGYYDLIIMDIQMPVMNGYEAAINIREMKDDLKASIPILAMTANAFEEDRKEAEKAGMNGHIAKPIENNLLIQELKKVLVKKDEN